MRKFIFVFLFSLLALHSLGGVASVFAASFNDAADGPWNGCTTWNTCPGAVEGTDYPGASDDVTIDSHTVTLSGAFAVNDIRIDPEGTLTSTASGVLLVDGNWNNNEGTFTAGNGRVIFKSGSNQTINTGGDSFYNFDIEDPEEPGLVGYWKMDEGEDNTCSGGEDVCDSSGNNYDGVIEGGDSDEWVTTNDGNTTFYNPYAMDFDGSNDYISISDTSIIEINENFSIAAWVNSDDISGIDTIFTIGDSALTRYLLLIQRNDRDGVVAQIDRTSEVDVYTSNATTDLTVGQWHHILLTRSVDTDEIIIYQDGVVNSSRSAVDTWDNITEVVRIGSLGEPSFSWDGRLDDVRLYNYALSEEQVQRLATGGYSSPNLDDGLIGYWKFDEGTGTVAEDFSGLNNSGSLVNMDESDWVAGYTGMDFANPYALDFDGDNDYVRIDPVSTEFNDNTFSIAFWANPDDVTTDQYFSCGQNTNSAALGNNQRCVLLGYQNSNWNVFHDDTYPTGTASDTQISADLNTWQHIVYTTDGSRLVGYKNGIEIFDESAEMDMSLEMDYYIIAASAGLGANYDGQADDFRLYNRRLSSSGIYLLANGGHDSSTFTLTGDLDVNGTLSLYNGALSADDNVRVASDWNNFAGVYSFEANASTVTLDGASQTFRGMGNTFHTLIKQGASDGINDAMTMAASGTYIITDTFKVHGATDSDITVLNSSDTTYDWHLFADNVNLQRMSVANSLNMETQKDINAINQTDGGGNTGWCFANCTQGRAMWFFGF